jgi:peptidoglycan/LPS O-acetylase OafA/YrhL
VADIYATNRMPALDGLRGVAILMVVASHTSAGWRAALSTVSDTLKWPPTFALPLIMAKICSLMDHGVTLFFVVSAFTLTTSLINRPRRLGGYALRRLARVAPGYWLAGIAYTILAGSGARLWAPDGVSTANFALAAVFASAWQGGPSLAVVPGGWSVSVEISFYIALPLLLWAIGGKLWRGMLIGLTLALLAQYRAHQHMQAGTWSYPDYCNPLEQMPVFMLGIMAAMVAQRFRMPAWPILAPVLVALAIVDAPFLVIDQHVVLLHIVFAAFVAPAAMIASVHPSRILANRVMVRIGTVSYSMYLIHFALLAPSLWLAERVLPANDWTTLALHFMLTAGLSFAFACLAYRWIEQPCILWAHRRSKPKIQSPPHEELSPV